jgi:UTP--glucose-1-phosphate uridylyltransferase
MAALLDRQPFHGLRFAGTRYDCGDKVGWLEANLAFALARDDMSAGVEAALKRAGFARSHNG